MTARNFIQQSTSQILPLGELAAPLLPDKFMRGKHHGGFVFCLYLFGNAFGAGAVQGGFGTQQKRAVWFIAEIKQSIRRFIKEAVFTSGFADFVRRLSVCGINQMVGKGVVVRQVLAAGYQTKIIEYCDEQGIEYAIRAKTSAALRAQIAAASASDWQPLLDKKGKAVNDQDTCRTSFCIGAYEKPFTLIMQRTAVIGQASLDLGSPDSSEEINAGAYIYRAIATNRDSLSDSEIVHWPNMTNMATWRGQREPNQGTEAGFWR